MRVVLFDGVCNLCNDTVNFIIDRDARALFHFASLQSESGQKLVRLHAITQMPGDEAVMLIDDNRVFDRSTAVLRILRELSGPWPLLYAFILVPKPLRDGVYRLIAKRRYRWFGKQETCRVPTPELEARFL